MNLESRLKKLSFGNFVVAGQKMYNKHSDEKMVQLFLNKIVIVVLNFS